MADARVGDQRRRPALAGIIGGQRALIEVVEDLRGRRYAGEPGSVRLSIHPPVYSHSAESADPGCSGACLSSRAGGRTQRRSVRLWSQGGHRRR
jgi:hypothetical protein